MTDDRDTDRRIAALEADMRAAETALVAQEKLMEARFTAAKDTAVVALSASKSAIDKSERGQNEYNIQHNDLGRRMIPREEAGARFQSLEGSIREIRTEIAGLRESRSGLQGGWAFIGGALLLIGAVYAFVKG